MTFSNFLNLIKKKYLKLPRNKIAFKNILKSVKRKKERETSERTRQDRGEETSIRLKKKSHFKTL